MKECVLYPPQHVMIAAVQDREATHYTINVFSLIKSAYYTLHNKYVQRKGEAGYL